MDKLRVGCIGCGAISGAYLGMARNFPQVEIVACADLNTEAARKKAEEFKIPRVLTVDELLVDPAVDLVLNLTVPKAHAPIGMRAIEAGKHVYAEKPLGINREEGVALIKAAKSRKLRVGNAPDTFLGAGHQTARKLIDEGAIGRPVAFTAFMMGHGHETWHPSPEFYYEVGGGPMFDMGPYYLTALINMLGPIKRVGGFASIAIPERTITSQPKHGKKIKVETPDHIAGTVEFDGGAVGTIVTSFAVYHADYGPHPIVVYGTEGTLRVPDPNGFDGTVLLRGAAGDAQWREMPLTHAVGCGRSMGLADMAQGILKKRPHRASGDLAMAVLDAMQGFLDSSAKGRSIKMRRGVKRPAALTPGMTLGQLD